MASSQSGDQSRSVNAVELVGSGGYDKLQVKTVPYRAPNADEVVLRIEMAGLNFADLMRR